MRATFHIKHPTWILCKSDYRECLIISSINRQRQSNILFGMTAMIKIKFLYYPYPYRYPYPVYSFGVKNKPRF